MKELFKVYWHCAWRNFTFYYKPLHQVVVLRESGAKYIYCSCGFNQAECK